MKQVRRGLLPAILVVLACACSGGASEGDASAAGAADSLTRRQRDSLISTLPIPGAGAVGTALRAADSARARALAHDSIGG